MNELDAQSLVVSAIREYGGFAMKLSHRFLVGVPDLLIQLPDHPTAIFEVKIDDQKLSRNVIKLKLTPRQELFIRDFTKAGGFAGVISFVRGKTDLLMAAITYNKLIEYDETGMAEDYSITYKAHQPILRGKRTQCVYETFSKVYYGEFEEVGNQSQRFARYKKS